MPLLLRFPQLWFDSQLKSSLFPDKLLGSTSSCPFPTDKTPSHCPLDHRGSMSSSLSSLFWEELSGGALWVLLMVQKNFLQALWGCCGAPHGTEGFSPNSLGVLWCSSWYRRVFSKLFCTTEQHHSTHSWALLTPPAKVTRGHECHSCSHSHRRLSHAPQGCCFPAAPASPARGGWRGLSPEPCSCLSLHGRSWPPQQEPGEQTWSMGDARAAHSQLHSSTCRWHGYTLLSPAALHSCSRAWQAVFCRSALLNIKYYLVGEIPSH